MPAAPYSGIILNQNAPPPSPDDFLSSPEVEVFPSPETFPSPMLWPEVQPLSQVFNLPNDYPRGSTSSIIPDLTGFQVLANSTIEATYNFSWGLDVNDNGTWVRQATGTAIGTAPFDRWISVYFDTPVAVPTKWLTVSWRIVIWGLYAIWYSLPSPPIAGEALFDDTTAITIGGQPASLLYRLLANIADSGTDLFGNVYRSAVVTAPAPAVAPTDVGYWLSKPNPSKFAVESLYFDMRDGPDPVVIDRLTLNPLTPGVYFRVYYSNDLNPGFDIRSWEQLMWTPVYKEFQANRQDTFALPEPIVAKYIKLEFTQLQARSYDPGQFELPATYKKHPKWVLDYFLARFAQMELDLLSSGVTITYDAIDLAFSYYRGDITQQPDPPPLSRNLTAQQVKFFQQENTTDTVDAQTLSLIRIAFQPFLNQPARMGRLSSILGNYAQTTGPTTYPVETIQAALADTSVVSNSLREPLILEKGFPVMFFFVPCRHGYRIAQATFEQHIAYYAGVKTVTFHREEYTGKVDQQQYNEVIGDGTNLLINDWVA